MEIDMEKLIQANIASKILENMPATEIKKVLEQSLAKTLKEVLSPWKIEKYIQEDVQKYMEEYCKQQDVQDKIRANTIRCVDELMMGIIAVIVSKSQDGIKSNYTNFLGKITYDDILEKVRKNKIDY